MKRVCQSVVLSVLIALGIVFAVHYGNVYTKDTEETVYLYFNCFSIGSDYDHFCTHFLLKSKEGCVDKYGIYSVWYPVHSNSVLCCRLDITLDWFGSIATASTITQEAVG